MGKRNRKEDRSASRRINGDIKANCSLLVDNKAVDPTLALLFASSVGILRLVFMEKDCSLYFVGWTSSSTSEITIFRIASTTGP